MSIFSILAHILHAPEKVNMNINDFSEFSASYINYYTCNAGLTFPKFGDNRHDNKSKEKIEQYIRTGNRSA